MARLEPATSANKIAASRRRVASFVEVGMMAGPSLPSEIIAREPGRGYCLRRDRMSWLPSEATIAHRVGGVADCCRRAYDRRSEVQILSPQPLCWRGGSGLQTLGTGGVGKLGLLAAHV